MQSPHRRAQTSDGAQCRPASPSATLSNRSCVSSLVFVSFTFKFRTIANNITISSFFHHAPSSHRTRSSSLQLNVPLLRQQIDVAMRVLASVAYANLLALASRLNRSVDLFDRCACVPSVEFDRSMVVAPQIRRRVG
jgi:hypothetical protein